MIRNILIIVLALIPLILKGQQLSFNNELIDTIIIRSHVSAYQFDDKGTTKGAADIIYITYEKTKRCYLINKFYRDKYKRTIKPDTIKLEKKGYKSEIGKILNNIDIQSLLTSLSTNVKI